jgi:hypothetical protein
MATKIITKTGSGAPTTSDVDRGELAVDLTNKQLYTNDGTDIIKLGSGSGEGQWSLVPNSDDIYYNDGNVGIGTSGVPAAKLDISTGSNEDSGPIAIRLGVSSTNTRSAEIVKDTTTRDLEFHAAVGNSGSNTVFYSSDTNETMRIASDGRVGIGGTPSRSTKEIEDDAVSTLASLTQISEMLKAEPKADKKAVTLEITGEDKLPTKAELIRRLTERNIGGGNAKLQVAGDAYFTGALEVVSGHTRLTGSALYDQTGKGGGDVGIRFQSGAVVAASGAGAAAGDTKDLGSTATRWRNGHFSGTVNGSTFQGEKFYRSGSGGFSMTVNTILPAGTDGSASDNTTDLGRLGNRFKDAHFSGDVNANRFTSGQFAAPSTTTYFQLNSGSTNVLELRETIFFPYTHDYTTLGRGDKRWKDAYFSGTIYGDVDGAFLRAETIVQDGAPVVDSLQIIRAFMKLRDAVDDPDSSVEELRDKLKVAVVDIIDQFQDLVDSVEPDRER